MAVCPKCGCEFSLAPKTDPLWMIYLIAGAAVGATLIPHRWASPITCLIGAILGAALGIYLERQKRKVPADGEDG